MQTLANNLIERFGDDAVLVPGLAAEVTIEVAQDRLVDVCRSLRDDDVFGFEMLIDLCGVDYLDYGSEEWSTLSATDTGFGRGVQRGTQDNSPPDGKRFAAVYHLMSIRHNQRVRVRCFCNDSDNPILPSIIDVWASADWYEREAFDLFGILFDGHPDLRRLLTDYGFIGHPFRKDFPLTGNVEVIFDPEKGRVVYQPVSIEPRTLVPRVIRDDNRYEEALKERSDDG